jgi:hypothetical protein
MRPQCQYYRDDVKLFNAFESLSRVVLYLDSFDSLHWEAKDSATAAVVPSYTSAMFEVISTGHHQIIRRKV